jgi:hypothetical protein
MNWLVVDHKNTKFHEKKILKIFQKLLVTHNDKIEEHAEVLVP